jgi:pimeloyl-ACP methyl ester carboxylesterase
MTTSLNMKRDLLQRCLLRLLCGVVVTIALAACTSSYPSRLGDLTLETLSNGARLGHVEIDDQGELQSFEQLQSVTRDLRQESRNSPRLVVVYVHGWNNGAADGPGSGDLISFRETLEKLAVAQNQNGGRRPYGVFVSWRGRTLKPSPMLFDFFHRYAGAERAGGIAGAEVIHEISAAARSSNPLNRILMVGHSFGGLLLESSISEALAARLATAHGSLNPGQEMVLHPRELPADLVVLINPAEAAIQSRKLIAAMTHRGVRAAKDSRPSPWIVSVTSQRDNANKIAFPAGNILGRWMPPFNFFNTSVSGSYKRGTKNYDGVEWGSQGASQRNTVGHFLPIHSHQPKGTTCNPNAPRDLAAIIEANVRPWDGKDILVRGKTCIYRFGERDPARFNHSPFWILQAPNELIEGHTGIWSADCIGMLTALMHLRENSPMPVSSDKSADVKVQIQLQSF